MHCSKLLIHPYAPSLCLFHRQKVDKWMFLHDFPKGTAGKIFSVRVLLLMIGLKERSADLHALPAWAPLPLHSTPSQAKLASMHLAHQSIICLINCRLPRQFQPSNRTLDMNFRYGVNSKTDFVPVSLDCHRSMGPSQQTNTNNVTPV
jgi:hypothetical protein